MANKQPKALLLADWLESVWMQYAAEDDGQMMQSATELRRLYQVNQELIEALETITDYFEYHDQSGYDAQEKALAALRKATE